MATALCTSLPDNDSESSGFEWSQEEQRDVQSSGRILTRRARFLLLGTLIGCAVVLLLTVSRAPAFHAVHRKDPGAEVQLNDAEAAADPCGAYPYYRIERVLHSNLGEHGPDSGAEGMVFAVTTSKTGLHLHDRPLELHVHAVGEYHPSWPKENGFHGNFARINLKAGSNVSLEVFAFNPETNETEILPEGSLTFFDLDTGKTSIEFVTSSNFTDAILTNETELERVDNTDGSTTFRATVRGNGDDNPGNPLEMSVLQKNRAVTLKYERIEKLTFILGCTE